MQRLGAIRSTRGTVRIAAATCARYHQRSNLQEPGLRVISFDIDGTMSFGDPPGHITVEVVRKAKELGYVVGSCSDRTIGEQTKLWQRADLQVDFMVLKHRLDDVKAQFPVTRYLHIGDTDTDQWMAARAGFDFLWVHEVPADGSHAWLLD